MKIKNIYTTLLLAFALMNCTFDSPDDLIEVTEIPEGEMISYNNHVKIIIDNNCLNCHSMPPQNGAPMGLVNYQQVRNAVENRGLIGLISTQDLSEVMPLGGPRLPQNLIDIIVQWQLDGFIE
ncbi:MAG: hypothetical protein HKN54_02475 [Flavobacteriaceae bacterium]|nr:hypothetical protein [Flavobacteriaceae bacterium]